MSIKNLLQREETKLVRQERNLETTKTEIEILGDSAIRRGKVERQEQAIKDTKSNIAKLKKAVAALNK